MSYDEKFDTCLDLLSRLDPKHVSKNLNDICTVIQNSSDESYEELTQDLLSSVDVPLKTQKCKETGKEYLCCDYNRDGDSYRSPWSNKYYPEIVEGDGESAPPYPSHLLRLLEIKANESFEIYKEMYYEGAGISSVYLWDTLEEDLEDGTLDEGFAGVVLIKKETEDGRGKWDSIHVFEVTPEGEASALYKLTSSVILDLQHKAKEELTLSGNLTRQLQSTLSLRTDDATNVETAHLINLGTLIEKSEYNLRNLLQEVYFDKLKDIIMKDLRSIGDINESNLKRDQQSELVKGINT